MIREATASSISQQKIESVQNAITFFVRSELEKGKNVNKREIQAQFKIDIRSYFKSMTAIYLKIVVDPYVLTHSRMGGQIDKNVLKERIIDFVRIKNEVNYLPTYKEIQTKFGCLPKLFFAGGIREIYQSAGIPYARKFAAKSPEEKKKIQQEIVNYLKSNAVQGYFPTWRDLENEFGIGLLHYFGSIKDIYALANVDLLNRQGLRK